MRNVDVVRRAIRRGSVASDASRSRRELRARSGAESEAVASRKRAFRERACFLRCARETRARRSSGERILGRVGRKLRSRRAAAGSPGEPGASEGAPGVLETRPWPRVRESDTDPRSPDPNGGGAIGTPASDAASLFETHYVERLAPRVGARPEPDVVADVACGPVAETRSTIAVRAPDAPATTPPTARATVAPWPMSCSQGDSDAMALSAGARAAAAAAAAAARSDASASANARTRRARSRGVGSAASRRRRVYAVPRPVWTRRARDADASVPARGAPPGTEPFSVFDSAVFDSAESKTAPRAADSTRRRAERLSAFHDPSRPITSVSAVISAVAFAFNTSKSSPRGVSKRARLSGADPEAARESGSRAPELGATPPPRARPKSQRAGAPRRSVAARFSAPPDTQRVSAGFRPEHDAHHAVFAGTGGTGTRAVMRDTRTRTLVETARRKTAEALGVVVVVDVVESPRAAIPRRAALARPSRTTWSFPEANGQRDVPRDRTQGIEARPGEHVQTRRGDAPGAPRGEVERRSTDPGTPSHRPTRFRLRLRLCLRLRARGIPRAASRRTPWPPPAAPREVRAARPSSAAPKAPRRSAAARVPSAAAAAAGSSGRPSGGARVFLARLAASRVFPAAPRRRRRRRRRRVAHRDAAGDWCVRLSGRGRCSGQRRRPCHARGGGGHPGNPARTSRTTSRNEPEPPGDAASASATPSRKVSSKRPRSPSHSPSRRSRSSRFRPPRRDRADCRRRASRRGSAPSVSRRGTSRTAVAGAHLASGSGTASARRWTGSTGWTPPRTRRPGWARSSSGRSSYRPAGGRWRCGSRATPCTRRCAGRRWRGKSRTSPRARRGVRRGARRPRRGSVGATPPAGRLPPRRSCPVRRSTAIRERPFSFRLRRRAARRAARGPRAPGGPAVASGGGVGRLPAWCACCGRCKRCVR